MGIDRTVRLLDQRETETLIVGKLAPGIRMVGYDTDNRLTNRGDLPWIAESGLPSVWILGMYNPSSTVTVVIPFVPGSEAERGVKVTCPNNGAFSRFKRTLRSDCEDGSRSKHRSDYICQMVGINEQ